MGLKDKIEEARNKLHRAISKKYCKKTILKYSRQVDKYIIEYYRSKFNKSRCQNSKKPIKD